MKLKILLFLFLSSLFLFSPKLAYADNEFDISTNSTYEVRQDGVTKISETISITNKTEFVYTPSYKITVGLKDIKKLETFNQDGSISSTLKDTSDGKTIEVTFPVKTVGLGKVNEFSIIYETSDIAKNRGNLWEVIIPGLSSADDFSSYNIKLSVPKTFGVPSITKPSRILSQAPFLFSKNDIGSAGILIIFGENQVYNLELTYNIANPKLVPAKTEIALPPQTSYQDTRINSLAPAPTDVYQDEDGNWLAIYNLFPGQTRTIKASVTVKVYGKPIFEIGKSGSSLSSARFWEVDDPEIKKVAESLKTPQAIYDYVVKTLSYSFDKVSDNNVRLGAKEALRRPDFSVCLEFTDLFIALSRASGIKSRAVEGYAYTENAKLRPLSLVRDVLHSWPEYFDEDTKTWIMVDPTWGNTTHGIDYFSSFDFDHIAFVIKGRDSTYPIPAGGYKVDENSKDVSVSIGNTSDFYDSLKSSISADLPTHVLSGIPISGVVYINNLGNVPIRNKRVTVKSELLGGKATFYVDIIPPLGRKSIQIEFPKTKFLTNKDYEVTILFDGSTVKRKISVGLFPDYFWILLGGVISFGSIIIAVAAYKTWSIFIQGRKRQGNLRREGKKS